MFARAGAAVVLGDVLLDQGEQVAREIAAAGGDAVFVPLDVTRERGLGREPSRSPRSGSGGSTSS